MTERTPFSSDGRRGDAPQRRVDDQRLARFLAILAAFEAGDVDGAAVLLGEITDLDDAVAHLATVAVCMHQLLKSITDEPPVDVLRRIMLAVATEEDNK